MQEEERLSTRFLLGGGSCRPRASHARWLGHLASLLRCSGTGRWRWRRREEWSSPCSTWGEVEGWRARALQHLVGAGQGRDVGHSEGVAHL